MAVPFLSSSGPASGTTSIASLNWPATKQIGDLAVLGIIYAGPASNVATIDGWGAKVLSASGGGMFIDLYTRRVAGGEGTGSVGTITIPGGTSSQAAVAIYRSDTGEVTLGPAVSGADAVSDTAYSATTGSITSIAGSQLVYCNGWAASMAGPTGRTMTQAGATLGTLISRFASNGAATRMEVGDRGPVVTGATAAVVWGATLAVATTGITGVLRLEQTPNGVNLTDGRPLQYHMNRKAGTLVNDRPTVEAQRAANIWAGTTGLELVGALNVRAGNVRPNYKELAGVLNQLAGTTGLEVDGAAASIP